MNAFAKLLISRITRRAPDFTIKNGNDEIYLIRWWVVPRNRLFNVYLHNILLSDDARALHSHPWINCSIVLSGGYTEVLPTPGATLRRVWRAPGSIVLRFPSSSHRIEVHASSVKIWTLFITGPWWRNWGFWCKSGWVHHEKYFKGGGCGEP
jgi:hypothetical protein